ncbi:DNA recombination/repair protein RecA, partial [Mycobacterium tuberculosis]|nr:DNA recombination/repair protein RecA [Mycobacterium tuberculosis]
DIGSDIDIVQKSGAWYSYEGERLGQGRENSKQFLKENPEIASAIVAEIRNYYQLEGKATAEVEAPSLEEEFELTE